MLTPPMRTRWRSRQFYALAHGYFTIPKHPRSNKIDGSAVCSKIALQYVAHYRRNVNALIRPKQTNKKKSWDADLHSHQP